MYVAIDNEMFAAILTIQRICRHNLSEVLISHKGTVCERQRLYCVSGKKKNLLVVICRLYLSIFSSSNFFCEKHCKRIRVYKRTRTLLGLKTYKDVFGCRSHPATVQAWRRPSPRLGAGNRRHICGIKMNWLVNPYYIIF